MTIETKLEVGQTVYFMCADMPYKGIVRAVKTHSAYNYLDRLNTRITAEIAFYHHKDQIVAFISLCEDSIFFNKSDFMSFLSDYIEIGFEHVQEANDAE